MSPGNQTIAILCPHRVREPRDDSMTRRIPSEEDLAARLIGRSFSSLVVNKLTQDIGSRTDDRLRVNEGELTCLVAILGKTSVEVATLHRHFLLEIVRSSYFVIMSTMRRNMRYNVILSLIDVPYITSEPQTNTTEHASPRIKI